MIGRYVPCSRPIRVALGRAACVVLLASSPFCGALSAGPQETAALQDRAFQGAQRVLTTQASRAVAQVGARLAAGDGPSADLVRVRQAAADRLEMLRRDDSAMLADVADAQQRLDELDERLRRDFPSFAAIANPEPLSIADVQGLLAEDEALLLFLATRSGTFVWAVTPGGSAWHRASIGEAQLSHMVRDLRAELDPTAPTRAGVSLLDEPFAQPDRSPQFPADIALSLYQNLIAPLMPTLAGVTRLVVVKDGPLSSLPLSVLLTAPLEDGQDLSTAPWLLRRFALSTLPDVASIKSLQASRQERVAAGGFLGFGDPDFARALRAPGSTATQQDDGNVFVIATRSIDAFFRSAGDRARALASLPRLPGTARELRTIADLFPGNARVVLGEDATEFAVRRADFGSASVISFATHGLLTGDMTGLAEPALAFTPGDPEDASNDGLLTVSEAASLQLNADWVILSACNTAATDGTPGAEGLSGLARGFLLAGARSILVSHWPVRDDVAARLTADTLARLRDHPDLPRATALRQAMLALIADDAGNGFSHPSAWAPFVVVGDGGPLPMTR